MIEYQSERVCCLEQTVRRLRQMGEDAEKKHVECVKRAAHSAANAVYKEKKHAGNRSGKAV